MKPNYSRLARIQEKKNVQSAFVFGSLTIGLILFTIFFGIPAIAKFTTLFSKKGGQNSQASLFNFLNPPLVNSLPEFTNKEILEVTGTAYSAKSVVVNFNGKDQETIVDENSRFSMNVDLKKGENTLFAKAVDANNNESEPTDKYTIVYDNEAPGLEITNPTPGALFYGTSQRQLIIQGKTDPEAKITINDRIAIVENTGQFKLSTNLTEGENQFQIVVVDRAGNKKETSISVTYNP